MSPVDRANGRPMTGLRAIRDRHTIRDRDMDKLAMRQGAAQGRRSVECAVTAIQGVSARENITRQAYAWQ
jgi:hypothetical protein